MYLLRIVTFIFTLVLSFSAMAEPPLEQVNKPLKRIVLGADFGSVEHKITFEDIDGIEWDKSAQSGQVFIGYQFRETIQFHLGYMDFGEVDIASERYSAYMDVIGTEADFVDRYTVGGSGVYLSALWETSPRRKPWGFYIEGGFMSWDFDFKLNTDMTITEGVLNFELEESDSGIDFFGGIGVTYDLLDNLELRLNATWYPIKTETKELSEEINLQYSYYGMGLNFRFY